MKISRREQILLWIFANIMVLLVGVKILLPKIGQYYEASKEHLSLSEEQRLQAEILLELERDLPERLSRYQSELVQIESEYFAKLMPEYIEAWIMNISTQYSIEVLELRFDSVKQYGEMEQVEVLPVELSVSGNTQFLFDFINSILNSGRYVVIEELNLEAGKANIKLEVYRVEKTGDELEQIQFNKPIGKSLVMD